MNFIKKLDITSTGLKPGASESSFCDKSPEEIYMSYVNILVHAIWSTKHRVPYLRKELRNKLIYHMVKNADENAIHVNFINGYDDHLHLLISLSPTQSISEIIHKIKGESSWWINTKKLTEVKFEWQSEYYAISISPDHAQIVRDYIRKQEQHHENISFGDEIKELFKMAKFTSTGFKPGASER